jgi:hypothetical protein
VHLVHLRSCCLGNCAVLIPKCLGKTILQPSELHDAKMCFKCIDLGFSELGGAHGVQRNGSCGWQLLVRASARGCLRMAPVRCTRLAHSGRLEKCWCRFMTCRSRASVATPTSRLALTRSLKKMKYTLSTPLPAPRRMSYGAKICIGRSSYPAAGDSKDMCDRVTP